MKTEIINTEYVGATEKAELYALFRRFYQNTNFNTFLSDFSSKQWLIRMTVGSTLAGFSTQQLIELPINEKTVRIIFSGDTIVHPDHWNSSHLAGAFAHLFAAISGKTDGPFYWLLISKGFRTYRFLPVFFKTFYPAHTGDDCELKSLLDAIGSFKFGSSYNPATECIELPGTKDCLCDRLAEIPVNRRNDPHVAYFLKRNPDYRKGTELACIAPLTSENLTKCCQRVIKSTEVEWHV